MTNNKKILVTEDDKPLAKALELKLGHSGFDVTVAYDGDAAIELLKKEKFDLAILDLMLPKKNGFQVLEELQSQGIKIPVIVLSNLSQQEDLKRVKDLGATNYFVKSNTPINDVVEQVKKTLNIWN